MYIAAILVPILFLISGEGGWAIGSFVLGTLALMGTKR